MMRHRGRLATFLVCSLVPAAGLAESPGARFTLGRYLPADVWMYTHYARNPERAWLDAQWEEVGDALEASGIEQDLASLVLATVGEADKEKAGAALEKWTRLIRAVQWSDLFHEEVAFAERLGCCVSPEYIVLARGRAGTAGKNMERLGTILGEIAGLSDTIQVSRHTGDGLDVRSLTFSGEGASGLSIELFNRGDVIGVATTRKALRDVAALMSGRNPDGSIVASPRFAAVLRRATQPEDGLSFFDFRGLIRSLNQMMVTAARHGDEEGSRDGARAVGVFKTLLSLADVLDYKLITVETEGRRELSHSITRLQPGKQKCALANCWLDRRPFARFDRFIPVDATAFSLDAFINLQELYKVATAFVAENLPKGEQVLARWRSWLDVMGLDPQRDLFSWWSGEMIRVSLPGSAATPVGHSEWVWMFRVKDNQLASEKIDAALSYARRTLQEHGQLLMVSPVRANVDGFRQISHPMLMMFFNPVVGVHGDWLMVGSSGTAIDKCLAVNAGDAPSIRQNERFQREGLLPQGPVLSCSFKDTSRFGEEMAAKMGVVGVLGGLVSSAVPDADPEAPRVKRMIRGIVGVLMKLGPVFRRIDFYSSESSLTTYDGELTVSTERVVTFKPPRLEDDLQTVKAR